MALGFINSQAGLDSLALVSWCIENSLRNNRAHSVDHNELRHRFRSEISTAISIVPPTSVCGLTSDPSVRTVQFI